jgi:hypothetical protein
VIPWNEAMNLPGSRQVGLGKKLFERFAWQECAPHPEWAVYADEQAGKFGPFSTGKAGEIRIIYVPESRPVKMQQLEDGAKYDARAFDPTSGEMTSVGKINPGDAAPAITKPERIKSDDWVIVLEREK